VYRWFYKKNGFFLKKIRWGWGGAVHGTCRINNPAGPGRVRFASLRSASATAHTFRACEPVVGARAATVG
jgi:hypothetical protein